MNHAQTISQQITTHSKLNDEIFKGVIVTAKHSMGSEYIKELYCPPPEEIKKNLAMQIAEYMFQNNLISYTKRNFFDRNDIEFIARICILPANNTHAVFRAQSALDKR